MCGSALRWRLTRGALSLIIAVAINVMLLYLNGAGMHSAHAAASAAAITDSWPTYMHDSQRAGASSDTILSPSNAAQLSKRWSYQTGGMIAAQPAVLNGVVYVGSWDGYEYALNATSGALLWKTFLGTTTASPTCFPSQMGVSSSVTVQEGVVYVGGGDAYWYALNAATGASLWKVYIGDNSATGGHYNWSSPLIYDGYAYVGGASVGDCPLVQGQLLQVSLSTRQVVNTLNIVPNGQTGGGIWTSPAVDPATNTIFVTTGTISNPAQTYAQAILAVDASTLTIKSSWQVPQQETVLDSDWGTSPILFTDANGRPLVTAINKNGYVYTFNRANLSAGPIWRQHTAIGGECPTCGDGSVSNLAFGNGLLYAAGGNTTINGVGYAGTVRALDPATGNIVWQHPESDPVIPALTYANGLVIAGVGSSLEALEATTGNRLYSFTTNDVLYSPPSVANGTIYFGSGDNKVYALGLPNTPPSPPPADPRCPVGWTCQDIGNPHPVGSEATSGSSWTITAGGGGVNGTADQFRMISHTVSGDSQISANVAALSGGAASQAGLMVRQNNTANSPYYAIFAMPNNRVIVQYRSRFGGSTTALNTIGAALPRYLEIQRTGDQFQAATSTDGSTYSLIPGTNATLILPYAVLEGVAVSSGADGTAGTAPVSGAATGAITNTPNPAPSQSSCPGGWTCLDVGNPTLVGDQSLRNGTWTLSGAGANIEGYADQFHYVWQTLTGDATISAHVTAQTNTDGSAKAGVMLRQNASAGAAFYGAFVTPSQGILVQYRSVQGLRIVTQAIISGGAPAYLEIARSGSNFSTYSSTDGVNWTYVVGSSRLIDMSGTVLAGLAITSANGATIGSAAMDTVAISNTAPPPPLACPSNWTCADIGTPILKGSESLSNGVWTIQGGGDDIWNTSDQFHYIWQTLAGDGALSAHVLSQQNTDNWAKAGLMLRVSTDPGAPFYAVYVTPSNGVNVQYRAAAGALAQQVTATPATPPISLRIGRAGTTVTAYTSSDGVTWSGLAGSTMTIASLTGTLLAGVAVTAHNGGALSTVTLDTVTLTNSAPPVACPANWTCADIGTPALKGSESVSNGVWTVQGGGSDIWNTSDQFHYIWQPLAGDGALSAQVTSQTNTSGWAKAGVMLRASTDPAAAYYAIFVTPVNGIVVQYRATAGGATQQVGIAGSAPAYLRVARSGSTFTAYTSPDGVTWTALSGSTLTLGGLSGTLLAGLAVTSHNGGALSTVTLDTVTLTNSAPPPPTTCPAAWICADIGNPTLAGAQVISNGVWTVQGGGSDIWDTSDQFHYIWQPLAGDGALSARVTSQTNTSGWAKAGVMLRASTDPTSAYYAMLVTPVNGIVVQYRTGQGLQTSQIAISGSVPAYLRVSRFGMTFTAYTSTDGATWSPVPGSAVTLTNLSGTLLAGLAITSHNSGVLSAVTFQSVARG
jgi:outer membrane protein assembly factor BamB